MQRYIDESKKVSHTLKEKINNFLKLTLKLIKLSGKVSSRGDYVDLKYEIEVENKLRAKKWLMEKGELFYIYVQSSFSTISVYCMDSI